MSPEWMEFMNDREVVACVDLVRGKDAKSAVHFEDGDRDHQVTGKLESMRLGDDKIVRHVERLHPGAGRSRSMAPKRPGAGRDHREGVTGVAAAR